MELLTLEATQIDAAKVNVVLDGFQVRIKQLVELIYENQKGMRILRHQRERDVRKIRLGTEDNECCGCHVEYGSTRQAYLQAKQKAYDVS